MSKLYNNNNTIVKGFSNFLKNLQNQKHYLTLFRECFIQ